ncbi:MAG: hypothetical protein GC171_07265 [Terrimonas sp.]|nr:hypothetical protein [Terrimonas sp.]
MYWINYLPIITTCFAAYFLVVLYRHWQQKKEALYIFWWMLGVFFYGAGTITESINTLAGFSTANFRAWYVLGALLGGAPLAQGTVYLLLKRRVAHLLAALLVTVIVVSTVLVILTPLHPELIENNRMSGKIIEWHFIRYITPFINIYAFLFLVGGAVFSAIKYAKNKAYRSRFLGNLLIALGGLLPGIGGSFTKFGYVEVLYVTELVGLICIYSGYRIISVDKQSSVHSNQAAFSIH